MKGAQHKVQDAQRYEGKRAQSSLIHNTVQNIRLPQIGLAQENQKTTPYREPTVFWKRHTGDHGVMSGVVTIVVVFGGVVTDRFPGPRGAS